MYAASPGLCGPSWHCGLKLHLTAPNVLANVCLVQFGWLIHRGPRLSNRPGNLNLLPKQLRGLSAWMGAQIVLHIRRRLWANRRRNLCVNCQVTFNHTKQFHRTGPITCLTSSGCLHVPRRCFHEHVIGWGVSVEVTTETRTSNFSTGWIHHQHHRRPALSVIVTSCLDHFQ